MKKGRSELKQLPTAHTKWRKAARRATVLTGLLRASTSTRRLSSSRSNSSDSVGDVSNTGGRGGRDGRDGSMGDVVAATAVKKRQGKGTVSFRTTSNSSVQSASSVEESFSEHESVVVDWLALRSDVQVLTEALESLKTNVLGTMKKDVEEQLALISERLRLLEKNAGAATTE